MVAQAGARILRLMFRHVCKLSSGNEGATFSLDHSIHQFPNDRMRKANMPNCQGHSKSIFLHTSATNATSSKRSMSARKEGKCPLPQAFTLDDQF